MSRLDLAPPLLAIVGLVSMFLWFCSAQLSPEEATANARAFLRVMGKDESRVACSGTHLGPAYCDARVDGKFVRIACSMDGSCGWYGDAP